MIDITLADMEINLIVNKIFGIQDIKGDEDRIQVMNKEVKFSKAGKRKSIIADEKTVFDFEKYIVIYWNW